MGTPGRLLRNAGRGALDVHNVRVLLLDLWVDAKARTLASMQETRQDLVDLLLGPLAAPLAAGDAKIALA